MAFRPKHWFLQLFIACDQLANVLITPLQSSAWADESMSSRCYRAWRDGKDRRPHLHADHRLPVPVADRRTLPQCVLERVRPIQLAA